MSINLSALQKQRRDTAANWTAENPTLLAGEIGLESDTGYWKVGDGSTAWTSLAYVTGLGAEIPVSRLADGTARQLLQTAANGTDVEWTSNVDVPGTLDVTGAATFDAAVTIQGDLTVNGTTTTIDTQNLIVEDKNVVIGNVTTPTDVTADGGGITLKGTTDKTINWLDATDAWTFSEHVNIASAKEYRIAGTKVLDATSLGSAVVSSSLTSVGTIGTGVWQGTAVATAYGGTGQTTYTGGQLLIGKTDGTLAKSTLTAGNGIDITNGDGSVTLDVDLKANGGLVIESTELALDLSASSITGTLGTADGGTGQTTYSNGQLLIGKTDGTLAKATITQGSGVTITNGDGSITISATGSGGTVTGVTATSPLASTGGTTPNISIQDGTTSQKGAVQLEDSTSSTSTTKAATPNSVKSAYDLANAALPKAGGTLTGDVTLNAQSDLRFADADSSNWVAFQAPSTVASNVTWTLPNADGASGQALTTNGSGALSWSSAGGATLNEFSSSGTWTKPSGANFVMIEVWGAGGGGGSGRCGGTSTARYGGGGGGAGSYNYRLIKASDLSSTVTVTIGTGGTGGTGVSTISNGNAGTAGGNTTFGSYLSGYGGNGGDAGSSGAGAGGNGASTLASNITSGYPTSSGNFNGAYYAYPESNGFGGAAGGASQVSATALFGGNSVYTGSGGGGGGGISSTNTVYNGGNGGSIRGTSSGGGGDGAAGGTSTTAGGNGSDFQGGGGGSAGTVKTGGNGGIASGGGGGGASLNGTSSGAGGSGGAGYCRVYTW